MRSAGPAYAIFALWIVISTSLVVPIMLQAQQNVDALGSTPPKAVSDKEMEAFVKAYVRYHQILQEYEPALRNAQNPKKRDAIQREANSKVKNALEEAGLTSRDYNSLFKAINSNKKLRQRALKLIEKGRNQS